MQFTNLIFFDNPDHTVIKLKLLLENNILRSTNKKRKRKHVAFANPVRDFTPRTSEVSTDNIVMMFMQDILILKANNKSKI